MERSGRGVFGKTCRILRDGEKSREISGSPTFRRRFDYGTSRVKVTSMTITVNLTGLENVLGYSVGQ